MHNYQNALLQKIINKEKNWDQDFEKLFIDIIPISIKILRKLKTKFNYTLLEDGDFLTKTFCIYEETIRMLQEHPNKISSVDDLLKILVPKFNNEFVKTIRKIEKNKNDAINHCVENIKNDNEFNMNTNSCTILGNLWFISLFVDAIKNNYFYTQLVLLKLAGKKNKQIAKILNISETKTHRYLMKIKNIYEKIKEENYIQ